MNGMFDIWYATIMYLMGIITGIATTYALMN